MSGHESFENMQARACNFDEWIYCPIDNNQHYLDYVEQCKRQEECYYQRFNSNTNTGNDTITNHLRGCKIYKLKGTKDLFLCDVCQDQERGYLADYLNESDKDSDSDSYTGPLLSDLIRDHCASASDKTNVPEQCSKYI